MPGGYPFCERTVTERTQFLINKSLDNLIPDHDYLSSDLKIVYSSTADNEYEICNDKFDLELQVKFDFHYVRE